jgi:hypothetical protein
MACCTCPGWLWWWRIWWNKDWQGKPEYSEKTCPSAILSTTNPTWPDPGLNPGRRGGKPATNRLSYVAANVWLSKSYESNRNREVNIEFNFEWILKMLYVVHDIFNFIELSFLNLKFSFPLRRSIKSKIKREWKWKWRNIRRGYQNMARGSLFVLSHQSCSNIFL